MIRFRKAGFMVAEIFMRFVINPRFRSAIIRVMGATVGRNVRIYEGRFINLENGFRNLIIEDDVFIGDECIIDLAGKLVIMKGATISTNANIITHTDPGSSHNSPTCNYFHPTTGEVIIGEYAWIGASCTLLSNVTIGANVVVGAGSLVNSNLSTNGVYVGVPARLLRKLNK